MDYLQSVIEAAHVCPLSRYEGCNWRCTCSRAAECCKGCSLQWLSFIELDTPCRTRTRNLSATQQGSSRWLSVAPCMPAGIADLGSAKDAAKASVAGHSRHAETDNNLKDKGAAD